MEKPSSLKKTIEAEIASDLKTKKFILKIIYPVAILIIIIINMIRPEKIFSIDDSDFLIIAAPLAIAIVASLFIEKTWEEKIVKKSEKVAFKFIRAKIIALLTSYLGENRIKDHKRSLAKIISELRERRLCYLQGENTNPLCRLVFGKTRIEICSEIEFELLEHVIKQNGKAIIIDGLRIDDEGNVIMNYYKNDSPGVFKMYQLSES